MMKFIFALAAVFATGLGSVNAQAADSEQVCGKVTAFAISNGNVTFNLEGANQIRGVDGQLPTEIELNRLMSFVNMSMSSGAELCVNVSKDASNQPRLMEFKSASIIKK